MAASFKLKVHTARTPTGAECVGLALGRSRHRCATVRQRRRTSKRSPLDFAWTNQGRSVPCSQAIKIKNAPGTAPQFRDGGGMCRSRLRAIPTSLRDRAATAPHVQAKSTGLRLVEPGEVRSLLAGDQNKKRSLEERFLFWWPGAESNHRHKDFQSSALPTELPGRI